MKRRDQLKKLQGLAIPELKEHISELGRELMNLRFRKSSRQLTNSAELKNTRAELARAKLFWAPGRKLQRSSREN